MGLDRKLLAPLVFLFCALEGRAHAQAQASSAPLLFWGIQSGEGRDEVAEAAVQQRLLQMGERPQLIPKAAQVAPCRGAACGLGLRSDTEGSVGRVLGGQIDGAKGDEIRGQIWWVDLATGKAVSHKWQCLRCDPLALLASEAAQLVQSAPTEPADAPEPADGCARGASPSPSPSPSAQPAVSSGPAEPVRTALEHGVALSVSNVDGAHAPVPALRSELQRVLAQMGVRSTAAQSEPAAAQLEIRLAGEPRSRRGTVDRVTMVLQAQGRERQLHFYCPATTCQSNLSLHLRLNLGVLLETGEPPLVALPPAPAPADCTAPRLLAGPITPAAVADGVTTPPTPAPVELVAPPPAPPATCKKPKSKTRLALQIAGGTLLGGGLIGLIPSAWSLSRDGEQASETGCPFDGRERPCVFDTRTSYTTGFAISAAGIAAGAVLLGLTAHPALRGEAEKCAAP